MLFSSWIFIAAFLPVTWGIFYLLQARAGRETALLWVTLASLFFYGWFKAVYVLILLVSLTFNFIVGTALSQKPRKSLLAFGVAANLAALAYYKYTGLFFHTLDMMGGAYAIPKIVLPLGISFYTFQQVTYLIDAYRGLAKGMSLRHFTLFVTFFPHMIAGPIVHHKEIIPQFFKKPAKAESDDLIIMGLTVFIIGLFKKVALADNLGFIADPVFTSASMKNALTFFESWLGVVSYSLQVYFDFSGYSDMAVGLAALFGVRMPVNFLSPYKSANIIAFWRRWHMTLSRLLREYLYFPLGGNRKGPLRRYINLIVTMLLGGLWHGANWTFVVWGALHGVYLVINHLWQSLTSWRMPRIPAMLLTFVSVMFAWVFFRAESFSTALYLLHCMAGKYGFTIDMGSRIMRINERWYVFWIALATVFLLPSTHELMKKRLALDIAGPLEAVIGLRLYWKPSVRWAVGLGLMAALSLLLLTKVQSFIYFQF